MSDADKNLNVKINIGSDTTGAKDAGKALGELNRDTNELADKTKKYIESLKEGNKEEEKSTFNKREGREILRSLGEQFGVVGELGRVAMLGVAGAFMFPIKLAGDFMEQIKELGDVSTPEFEGLTKAVEDQEKAIRDVDAAAAAYQRSLDNLARSGQSVRDASAAVQSRIKAEGSAEKEALEKGGARDNAALEAAEKLGLITHQQYIARKLALDEQYAQRRIDLENKVATAGIIEKYRERANTQIHAGAMERALKSQTSTARDAAGKQAFSTDELAADKANLEKTEQKIKDLEKESEDLSGFHPFKLESVLRIQRAQNSQQQKSELETAYELRARIAQVTRRLAEEKENKAVADEDVSGTRSSLRADRERMKQLDEELPGATQKNIQDAARRDAGGAMDSQARALKALPELAGNATTGHAQATAQTETLLRALLAQQSRHLEATTSHDQTIKALAAKTDQLARDAKNHETLTTNLASMGSASTR